MNDAEESPLGVGPGDFLLRRVLHRPEHLEWHDDFARYVPALAAIRFDPDGMSAFLCRLLKARGHGEGDVSSLGGTSDKPAVVYEVRAEAIAEVGFDAEHSPNADTPIGYAHASILKPRALTRQDERKARNELARRMTLVYGTIELTRPDGA